MGEKNKKIVDEFERLIKQIKLEIDTAPPNEVVKHRFRLKQIQNVLNIIKKFPDEINSGEQLKDIKGVGKGSIDRIDEIIKKGKLEEIKIKTKEDKYLKQIEELEQLYGVGRKTAYNLIKNEKIKSIDDLRKKYEAGKIQLPYHIQLGLKYHGIYKQTIPRDEIGKIDRLIKKVINKLGENICHVVCGSYRRQKPTSNDIDILVVHKDVKTRKQIKEKNNPLHRLVNQLKIEGFLLDDIDEGYVVKYMGFCKLGDAFPVRRIDMMLFPLSSYHTALLHLTGSGDFNRRMRETAIELDYKLNQYGLYDENGKKIKVESERDIFEKLGLEYVEPIDRS